MNGKFHQIEIVAHKDACQRRRRGLRHQHHTHAQNSHHHQAFAQERRHFLMVLRAKMKTHHRRHAHAITQIERHKYPSEIHNDAVGCHTVLAYLAHQLIHIEHAHQLHGDIHHKFGESVAGHFPQTAGVKSQLSPKSSDGHQAQGPFVVFRFENEAEQRYESAHHVAAGSGPGGAFQSPIEHSDKEHIEQHIGYAGGNHQPHAEFGSFGRHQKRLEIDLQSVRRQTDKQNAPVIDTIGYHVTFGSEENGDIFQKNNAAQAQDYRKNKERIGNKTENLVGLALFSFA